MKRRRAFLLGILMAAAIGSLGPGMACAEEIVGGFGKWYPWTYGDSPKDAGGILVDIFKEAVTRAGHEPAFRISPHKRRNDVEWGKRIFAELGCIPEWREKYKSVSVYTEPFIETRDILLARKGELDKGSSTADFYGKRIGTTLGYYYPDGFSDAFEAGKIDRDDSPEGSSLMKKLAHNRVDGIIIDRNEAAYWINTLDYDPDRFEPVYTFSSISRLRLRLHTSKAHLIPELNRSMEEMKKDGTIRKIIEKYIREKNVSLLENPKDGSDE